MKKETLEEVAERLYLFYENNELLYGHSEDLQLAYKAGVFDGAKWQAERMYSEEEVLNLLDFINDRLPNLYSGFSSEEELKERFEQFKKK